MKTEFNIKDKAYYMNTDGEMKSITVNHIKISMEEEYISEDDEYGYKKASWCGKTPQEMVKKYQLLMDKIKEEAGK